jgi:hypothetical protein
MKKGRALLSGPVQQITLFEQMEKTSANALAWCRPRRDARGLGVANS